MKIKVTIFEDNDTLRETLCMLINTSDSLELMGAWPDAKDILVKIKDNEPDVILMDIDMPVINGIQATSIIKENYSEINVMMLTVFEDKDKIFSALCAGASGYLLKKTSGAKIVESIIELYNGGSPISIEIARKVLEFFRFKPIKSNTYALTDRERDILKCILNGDSYKMIADTCNISMSTVRTHINNVYKKLHVNSKSEAAIKAMKENLV